MEIPPSLSIDENKKVDFFEQYRWPILAALVVILTIGIYLVLVPPAYNLSSGTDVFAAGGEGEVAKETNGESATSEQIVIDVAGAINQPGVYHINSDSIVEDAVIAAGGFSTNADMDAIAHQINRAEELKDHSKIYIPKKGETTIVYTEPSSSSPSRPTASEANLGTRININSADSASLETLPTIGPVLAQRIIDYRLQNGPFQTPEDIKEVNGISDAKFDQFKDLITI